MTYFYIAFYGERGWIQIDTYEYTIPHSCGLVCWSAIGYLEVKDQVPVVCTYNIFAVVL